MRSLFALLALLTGCGEDRPEGTVRVATYNVHLARGEPGTLIAELEKGSAQIDAVVAVIAEANPDILLINELDFDTEIKAFNLFRKRLVDAEIKYAHAFLVPVNTGVPTNMDLHGSGKTYGPENAQGWGVFEGQFGMAILSRFPIAVQDVRVYAKVRWADMPGSLYPEDYYPPEAKSVLRLSSKGHWDVPLRIGEQTVHLLASHPTPPVFDGPEDRNGLRNADEIRFWVDYIDGKDWMKSDDHKPGGLTDEPFVILGDLNNDPQRGDGREDAISALLNHPKIIDVKPLAGGETATASWKKTGPMRVDYVLPSAGLTVIDSGIMPKNTVASDHRLVWVDIKF